MKKDYKKIRIVGSALLITAFLLAGCGSSTSEYAADSPASAGGNVMKSSNSPAYAESDNLYGTETDSVTEESAAMDASGETQAESPVTDNRKLIKTVSMDVETEAYDALMTNVEKKINLLGGYVSSLDSGENGYGDDTRYATIIAKVPAEKVDQFVTEVSDISNVISKNESVDDVTLQYVDLESHKKALLTEQESLLKLMESATSMEDIITIESRLSEVRYQLESMESQLRTFDNQVAYSEVTLYITEVTRLTPMEEVSTWDKISEGFMDNVERVGNGFKNFFIQLIINLPIIFVIAVFGVIVFFIVRFAEKKSRIQRDKILAQRKETQEKQRNQTQIQQPQTQQSQTQQSQQTALSSGTQSYGAYVEQRDKENEGKGV